MANEVYTRGYVKSNAEYGNMILAIEDLKSSWNSDNYTVKVSEHEKDLSDLDTERSEYETEHTKDLAELAKKETELNDSYVKEKDEENTSFSKYETDTIAEKDKSLLDGKNEYETDMVEKKSTYESDIKDAKKSYEDSYFSAVEKAANEITSALKSTSSAIKSSASVAGVPNTKKSFNVDAMFSKIIASSADMLSPIEELFKKIGIRGYNVGGFVQPTSTSMPGKDSILASLTPEEYVIPDKVVDFFGKEFFDDILHYRIRGYNTGGYVSRLPATSYKDNSKMVKHVLDLTINGQHLGEVIGEKMTIEGLIQGLSMARMRTNQ